MKVHGTSKKIFILKQCNFIECQDTHTKKILSMTTSNYKLDTRYALVDTDIINDKKNIIYTEANEHVMANIGQLHPESQLHQCRVEGVPNKLTMSILISYILNHSYTNVG